MREFLYAPDDQPARTWLVDAVGSGDTDLSLDPSALSIDEQEVLSQGAILEVDYEQVIIKDGDSEVLTVLRGANGTTAAAHDAGATVVLAPAYGRQAVLDAISDNIVALFPSLAALQHVVVEVEHPYTELPADVVRIESITTGGRNVSAHFVRNPPEDVVSGRALITHEANGTEVVVAYRSSFPRPDSPDDELEDLGLEPGWERLVVLGAASQILDGRDAEPVTMKWVTDQMGAEAYPPSTTGRISDRIYRKYALLLREASRKQLAEGRSSRARRFPASRRVPQ